MKKAIIFGTGEFGKNIFNINKEHKNIICFCDNDTSKHNQILFDKKIISPNKLNDIEYDEIIIASTYAQDIYFQLINELKLNPTKIKKLFVNESNIQFYSKIKKDKSEEFMFFICNLLEEHKITYYLDHGTLLGIIRDNNLIPWDKDIDLAVFASEEEKIYNFLNKILPTYKHPNCKENNWKYKIAKDKLFLDNRTIDIIVELQIYNDSNYTEDLIALDLMFRYILNDKLHWKVADKHLSIDSSIVLPMSTVKYKGNLLYIPNQTSKYLEKLFGDWKTPIKQWSYDNYTNNEDREK